MVPLKELPVRERALAWFAAVGAALAWGLHFTLAYWYAEGACQNENAVGSVEPVVIALTVILGAVALAAALAALRLRRALRRGAIPDPRERLEFFALAGVVAGVVFGFAIVLEGVQVLAIGSCVPG